VGGALGGENMAVATQASVPGSLGVGADLRRLIAAGTLGASTLKVSRRDVVYSCLDGDRSIYLIEQGQLKAVAPSADGKECLLNIFTTDDVFGELCLLGTERRDTVTAMTPAVLRRVSAAKVLAAMADTSFRHEFVKYMARRMYEQQQTIAYLVTVDSEHRLAAILLHLGRKLGRRDGHILRIEERITQDELAGMVGTTRSRVGYFLKNFRQAGLVARRRDCFLALHEQRLDAFIVGDHPAVSVPRPSVGPAPSGPAAGPAGAGPRRVNPMAGVTRFRPAAF
jgi:CRP/FNR family transcriptional regulator, cyclic AMP receptor protein